MAVIFTCGIFILSRIKGICADMIATLDGFTRDELDALAVESQNRAQNAIAKGYFEKSVIPVYNDDGSLALDREEFPRPGTSMESLAELNTVFNLFMDAPIDNSGETFDQLVKGNTQISKLIMFIMPGIAPALLTALPH